MDRFDGGWVPAPGPGRVAVAQCKSFPGGDLRCSSPPCGREHGPTKMPVSKRLGRLGRPPFPASTRTRFDSSFARVREKSAYMRRNAPASVMRTGGGMTNGSPPLRPKDLELHHGRRHAPVPDDTPPRGSSSAPRALASAARDARAVNPEWPLRRAGTRAGRARSAGRDGVGGRLHARVRARSLARVRSRSEEGPRSPLPAGGRPRLVDRLPGGPGDRVARDAA